jgi:predicted O-methyltransferase YrrM
LDFQVSQFLSKLIWAKHNLKHIPEIVRKIQYRWSLKKEIAESKEVLPELASLAVCDTQALIRLFPQASSEPGFFETHSAEIKLSHERIRCSSDQLGGAAALDFLYRCVKHQSAKNVLETGVAYGWSSFAILAAMSEIGGGILVSIDFPQFGTTGRSVGLAVPPELKKDWRLLIGPDRQMLQRGIRQLGQLDMCHYDSDKSISGRKFAYPLLWNALRDGGIFISDDIADNRSFLEFANEVNREPIIVASDDCKSTKYIGVLKKC